MRKLVMVFGGLAILFLAGKVMAKQETQTQSQLQTQQQTQQQLQLTGTPTGAQNKNQNQNQGQTQNREQEEEQESTGSGEGLQIRNQNAVQNMSEVAKQVQELLQTRTQGGIGEQVREVAREQNQAQEQIQEQLVKLESKVSWLKRLFGPDFGAIKNLRQLMEQNQERIAQLEQLQNQINNQADETRISQTIQAMLNQNLGLQEQIRLEEKITSLFGWLFKWLAR